MSQLSTSASSLPGAVFKGLAIATYRGRPRLYATDFRHGLVYMFDETFNLIGNFTDIFNVLPGYAPFGITTINNMLYVSFAVADASGLNAVAGNGNGFVSVFDPSGTVTRSKLLDGTFHPLNAPWGMTLAPSSFGPYAGRLLVGNVGDGHINAFDLNNGLFFGGLFDIDNRDLFLFNVHAVYFRPNDPALYFSSTISTIDSIPHGIVGQIEPASTFVAQP